MINTILTPEDAKSARASVGLSQNKVAQAVGLSRTNLALFEVQKYLLDNDSLIRLKQFYTDSGYMFDDTVEQSETVVEQDFQPEPEPDMEDVESVADGIRLMDGYAVPAELDSDEMEGILTEIADNEKQMETLSEVKPKVSWWDGSHDTEGVEKLMRLSARNYTLIKRLQGHGDLLRKMATGKQSEDDLTNGQLFFAELQN